MPRWGADGAQAMAEDNACGLAAAGRVESVPPDRGGGTEINMKRSKREREYNGGRNGHSMDILQERLRILWQAPAPQRRDIFLAGRPRPSIGHGTFVLTQAAYIRKRVWVLSVAVFAVLVGITAGWQQDVLWVAASAMPFFALTAVQEQVRSFAYNMTELELATRFSVKSIMLARMGLLGGFHLALLCLLFPVLALYEQMGIWHTGVYLLVPYLATTFLSMVCSRKVRGRETIYLCLGNAVLVGSVQIMGQGIMQWYEGRFFGWWILALALLLAGNAWEYYRCACQAGRIYEQAGT